ncbi:hypothetical protein Pcac1_g28796 [Phytophthora cactorum]|nr:hypothetical protein Pcac1_g28796 [Phytophthora cactorum]
MSHFDESAFGLSPRISDEDVDDLDVDSLDIDDDGPRQTGVQADGEAQEFAQVTKMNYQKTAHCYAIGLDWKTSAAGFLFLFAPSGRRRRRKIW